MKVAISGASGFIGSHLRERFKDFTVLDRGDSEEEIVKKLKGVAVVINLSGAPIVQKWTPEYKELLISSRIDTTKKLVNAINKSGVSQFISASAIGIYPNNKPCDEECDEIAGDFLSDLVVKWEHEAKKCKKSTAIFRFGVVLATDGGAFGTMLPTFKMGLGGTVGNGSMMTSWIDIEDLLRIYEFVIQNRLEGIYNVVSPKPITNFAYTKAIGKALFRPTFFPLSIIVAKMLFGEGVIVLTGSKEIYPKALLDAGFKFKYPDIHSSLTHLLGDRR